MENEFKTCKLCGDRIPNNQCSTQYLCSVCQKIVDKFCDIPTVNPVTKEELKDILERSEQKGGDTNGTR